MRPEADALLKMRQDRGKAINPARQPENDLLAGRWVSKGAMVAAYATLIVVTLGISASSISAFGIIAELAT